MFIGIQTIEQATDPLCVLVKQCLGQAFSPCGQYDLQATAILSIAATLQQFFALQAIEQAADGGAGHACAFGQLVGRQRATGPMQQEQHDEATLTEPVWRQPGGAIVVDGRRQRQQLEAQAQLRDVGVAASLRLIHQGMVLGFDHLVMSI